MWYILIIITIFLLWLVISYFVEKQSWKRWWGVYDSKPFNFPLKYKGRTIWHSRACAVAGFVFAKNRMGEWCILANQRGEGTPDFQGMWNCPCGFIDFNETGSKACAREIYEECGLRIVGEGLIKFLEVNDDPEDSNNQNITLRYYAKIEDLKAEDMLLGSTGLGEKNEVEERLWIPMSHLDDYKWAFNHKNIIKSIYNRKIVVE